MMQTALVLEGGGLRGVFTSGVLEAFMEENLYFDHVYATSAGASNAVTYLARQKGRNERVFIDYINNPEYKGFRSWLLTGNFFNKSFIFEKIPELLDPFDYNRFFSRSESLHMPVTNALTGEVVFLHQFDSKQKLSSALKAATSLPILAKPEVIEGIPFFDGGISCPISVKEVVDNGYGQIVFVLTQPKGYIKEPSKITGFHRFALRKYPKIIECLKDRHHLYNQNLKMIEDLEARDLVKVIRPKAGFTVDRLENNKAAMHNSFNHGYSVGKEFIKSLKETQSI